MLAWYQFLIGFAGVFGLFQAGRLNHRLLRVIVVIQVVGIVLSFVGPGNGIVLFYLGALLMALYGFLSSELSTEKKIVISLLAVPVFIQGVFAFNHWPFVFFLKWLQVVPILVFLIKVLPRHKAYKKEIGPLLILATDALIQVVLAILYLGGS